MKFRLRHILALAFILIAIIPVLLLGIWVEETVMDRERASVSEKHLLLAQNLTSALDRYADDTKAVFNYFTATAETEQPSPASLDLAREIGFQHICLIDVRGQVTERWAVNGDSGARVTEEIARKLRRMAGNTAAFSGVMPDGVGDPALFLTRVLPSGRLVVAALSLDYIRKVQKEIAFGRNGHSAIVDQNGNVIAHPRPDWQREMKNIAALKPVSLMLAGKTGVATFFSPAIGKDMITGYTAVPSTGWGVMVPQPMAELEARADQVRQMAFGLIVIGLVAAALIGWFLAGVLVRPVKAVARAAQEIAQGNLNTRVPAYAGGAPVEYRDLGSAFNGMARDLTTDITARERAEAALRESEEQIRLVLDAMPIAIAYIDAEERYVMVNKKGCEWIARPEAEIVGKRIEDVLGTRYQLFKPAIRDVLLGRPVVWETRMTYPDGITRDIRVNVTPKFGTERQVRGWFTMVEDISDRKQAEVALKESEQRLRSIFENSPSAILLKDQDGRYQMINNHYATWYGLSAREWQGKTAHEIYPSDFAERIAEQDRKVLESGETSLWEADQRFLDEESRSIIATKFLISDENGKPTNIGSIITDVTAQRQSEALLHQAQKMEVIGQLTGGIAHDFNNLLGIVIGNLDFLADRLSGNDELLDFAESATKTALRGAELTQQLLAFSRKQSLAPQAIDLGQQVKGLENMLQRVLGETINVVTTRARDLWECEADPGQLESAVLNLAVNARDAMPDGGRLTIETANIRLDEDYALTQDEVVPGDYVMLSVSDDGVGMPPNILAKVFEPFFTTKGIGEGSGLGLSMVFGFAKQSGGHVTIESVARQGTSVKLYLPRISVGREDDEEQHKKHLSEARGKAILVVEDDSALRCLVIQQLRALGYVVLDAPDGDEALEVLGYAASIDLLLTDVVLPGRMSGPELAAAAHRQTGVKTLFMSGYTKDTMAHRGSLGDDALLLQKPFRKTELAVMVHAVLNS